MLRVCKISAGNLRLISANIKEIYKSTFGIEVLNQDKIWLPHKICNRCHLMMTRYDLREQPQNCKYVTPACWLEPSCKENCYICMTNVWGINRKNVNTLKYPKVPSLVEPVLNNDNHYSADDSLDDMNMRDEMEWDEEENENKEDEEDEHDTEDEEDDKERDGAKDVEEEEEVEGEGEGKEDEGEEEEVEEEEKEEEKDDGKEEYDNDEYSIGVGKSKTPKIINQAQLSDVVRDLGLSKDKSEFLASFMKSNNWLTPESKVTYYRDRDKEFRKYFTMIHEPSFVYCNDVQGLIDMYQPGIYKAEEWRLFIDASKESLKVVLLQNTNNLASIPIGHSTEMKEMYSTLKFVLEKIKYAEQGNWLICGDLKILTILLGQQGGYTKYPCFLCLGIVGIEQTIIKISGQIELHSKWILNIIFWKIPSLIPVRYYTHRFILNLA